MNLEIITPKLEYREDAMFYYGKEIAKVQLPNGKKLYLESRGELEIFLSNGNVKGSNALDWLLENNYNDENLNEIYVDDRVIMSNWFVIVEVDVNGETISDDLGLSDTYTEALDVLSNVYEDFYE
jgi:hypothetical protein